MSDTSSIDPFFNPQNQPKKKPVEPKAEPVSADTSEPKQEVAPQAAAPVAQISIDALATQAASPQAVAPVAPKAATPQIIAKQGTKINFKTFAVGCGIFFWLFLLLVIVWLYIAISNPTSLSNLGLDIQTVKSVLLIFAVLFFGLLFFLWFAFAALNGYRFFTVKEGSRVRYVVWLIVWLVLLFGAIGLGLVSYTKISEISEEKTYNTNDMVIPHIQVKKFDDGDPSLSYSRVYVGTAGLPLIAPTYMDMQINRQIFDNLVAWLGQVQFTKFVLECGNGQVITNEPTQISSQYFFQGSCLYLKKGQYNVRMLYSYFDSQQGIEITKSVERAATIDIATDVNFNVEGGDRKLNDNKNEIILGTAPAKILVDAQKIFTDLNIPTIQILWDMDGNGSIDKQNRVSFTYYFDEPKLYNAYFSIPLDSPALPAQIWYLMRYRVNAGDVPPCELETNRLGENRYELFVRVDDKGTDISEYNVDIIDNQTDEIVNSLKSDKSRFDYEFANGRSYRVRWYFTTTEGKRGSCEASQLLDIGYNSYSLINTFSVIGPNDKEYKVVWLSGANRVEGDNLIISDIPTTVKLVIQKIVPEIINPQISVFENGILKNPTKNQEYVFKFVSDQPSIIKIDVNDGKWKSATKTYTVKLERQNLIGKLKASRTVGFDPLIVEFDASVTKLNDPDDEVVYFTWDFGDGEVRKNTSVGKITHTYRFDPIKENGEFQPKVTVKTKKGLSQEIVFPEKIIVKRQIKTFEILLPSHPAQLARVGDIIEFAIQADGKITGVTRDFGNGKKLTGAGREFAEATMKYDESGLYEVFATVEFSDHPPVSQNIKLKIE